MRTFEMVDKRTGELTFSGVEVTQSNPCPICGHQHSTQSWCLIDIGRGKVICPRVESEIKVGDAGWLHSIDGDPGKIITTPRKKKQVIDFRGQHSKYLENAISKQGGHSELSEHLGISRETLIDFQVGWDGQAWTFPMYDYKGMVVGIRKRGPTGKKWSESGSSAGLFQARNRAIGDVPEERVLLICEGETDAMVSYELGFDSIGRPGAGQATRLCISSSYRKIPVVMSDNDDVGLKHAKSLVNELKNKSHEVCLIRPPLRFKDLRSWYNDGGCNKAAIQSLVRQKLGWIPT